MLSQNKKAALRIYKAISQLPLGDVKPLHSNRNPQKYRLRVGNYRIIFCADDSVIYVLRIDNRGDVYK